MARHRQSLIIASTVVILLGIFVGLGANFFVSRDTSMAVAEVGGTKIPYALFQSRVRQVVDAMRERGTEVTEALEKQVKEDILRDMIVEEIFAQKGAELGLAVSDLELTSDIQRTFRRGDAFDQRLYFQTVITQFHMSPEEYEAMRRRSLLSYKFRQIISNSIKVTPAEAEAAYLKEHGSMKGFEAEKDRVAERLHQERSIATLNYYLRQLSGQLDIKSYLEAREKGA